MALVVTPALTEYRYGDAAAPPLSFVASGATGTVHWSTNFGSVAPATGASTVLTPPNESRIVTVTANDDLNTVLTPITIHATLPVQPQWGVQSDLDPRGLTRWPMVYSNREYAEYWALVQFFKYHGKAVLETSESEDGTISARVKSGLPFYVDDIATGDLVEVYFDSVLRREFADADFVGYSFQLVAINYVPPLHPATGPFVGEV